MKVVKIKIEFAEELLGTASADPELHRRFVASKSPDAMTIDEEVAALGVDAVEERGVTVFPRLDDGTPFVYDYQLKGFFKDACYMLRKTTGTRSKDTKGMGVYKTVIDGMVFPQPRKIPLVLPEGATVGRCERPLRASTPQGVRVALAASESVPAGTTMEFEVTLLADWIEPVLKEWFAYGSLRGLGQWRNSGKGKFRVLSCQTRTLDGIGGDEAPEKKGGR